MKQSAFTILAPVKTGAVEDLTHLLDAIGEDIKGNAHLRLGDLAHLHYASLFIVAGDDGPCLVFEGNVDGRPADFLDHLLETAGEAVDEIYGHCAGYPSSTAGSRADRGAVRQYLMAHDIGANTFFVAWPGQTVDDVRRQQDLHTHIQGFLDDQDASELRRQSPEAVHRSIAASLPADMEWARTPKPVPFLVEHGKKVLVLLVAPPVLGLVGLVRLAMGGTSDRRKTLRARVGLAGVVALLAAVARRLRSEEAEDDRLDRQQPNWQEVYATWVESRDLSGIVAREDHQVQNHMVSVTAVKPGWYRLTLLRAVLGVINLLARLTSNKGSLGGISSIHFARWVITPDGKRLLFMSNYDGSWESYLNDFIDLAAQGLTAVWSNTGNAVRFPRTRWLVLDGARDEARFKAYARFSMVPTNVWYSAYPDISVANIANNTALRDGLTAPLDRLATEAWLRRL